MTGQPPVAYCGLAWSPLVSRATLSWSMIILHTPGRRSCCNCQSTMKRHFAFQHYHRLRNDTITYPITSWFPIVSHWKTNHLRGRSRSTILTLQLLNWWFQVAEATNKAWLITFFWLIIVMILWWTVKPCFEAFDYDDWAAKVTGNCYDTPVIDDTGKSLPIVFWLPWITTQLLMNNNT